MDLFPRVTIYADGACVPNPGHMGAGIVLISGPHRKELSVYLGEGTNQLAEITAATRALLALKHASKVTVYSDSQYLVRTMNGEYRRKTNLGAWDALDAACKRHEITWEWVRGHADNPDNERADALANEAVWRRK